MIGVPDSKLKDLIKRSDIVATDEGEAICYAVGEFLVTGKPGTAYMGSNGFANALEALTSLVVPYEIPINLVIGVRDDCPQHAVMGSEVHNILSDLFYEHPYIHIKTV